MDFSSLKDNIKITMLNIKLNNNINNSVLGATNEDEANLNKYKIPKTKKKFVNSKNIKLLSKNAER